MDFNIADALEWYLVFLFSTTCHEAAHAYVAHKLGDDTAYRGGQVSLDPTPHIQREPFGMVVIPFLSWFIGGWMIGWASAPYDPRWAAQYPRRAAFMSLAGPAANLVLAIIAAAFICAGMAAQRFEIPVQPGFHDLVVATAASDRLWGFAAGVLSLFFSLNVLLATFNLLPVPPLDGSNIPFFFLSEDKAEQYRGVLAVPAFSLIGLIIAWRLFDAIFPTIFYAAVTALYRVAPG
jgi:Zn-dependent protease